MSNNNIKCSSKKNTLGSFFRNSKFLALSSACLISCAGLLAPSDAHSNNNTNADQKIELVDLASKSCERIASSSNNYNRTFATCLIEFGYFAGQRDSDSSQAYLNGPTSSSTEQKQASFHGDVDKFIEENDDELDFIATIPSHQINKNNRNKKSNNILSEIDNQLDIKSDKQAKAENKAKSELEKIITSSGASLDSAKKAKNIDSFLF